MALRFRPLDRVGVLLPRDGMAVSLLLSLAVPALVAGVREILVAMAADSEGRLPKGVLAACEVLGLRRVLRVGGTMGALALAFGTETTPAVDLLFGEDGDQARACMRALAGLRDVEPTDEAGDLVVISDGTESDPARLADELILHAELGGNGLRVVLCTDSEFMSRFTTQLREAYDRLPRRRRSVVRPALSKHGRAVLVRSLRRAVQIVNELAPDRLYLLVHTPQKLMSAVHRAGAVHVGELAAPSRVIWNWGSLGLPGLRYGWIPTAARFLQPVATLRGEPGGQTDVARLQRVWSELEPLPSLGATRSGARPEPEGRPAAEPTAS